MSSKSSERPAHGHSHRSGIETTYWREPKPLCITLVVFVVFAILVNLTGFGRNQTFRDRRAKIAGFDVARLGIYDTDVSRSGVFLYKTIDQLKTTSEEEYKRIVFDGPNLLLHEKQRLAISPNKIPLALIIPIEPLEFHFVEKSFNEWNSLPFPACTELRAAGRLDDEKVTLMFHYNSNGIADHDAIRKRISGLYQTLLSKEIRKCFSNQSPLFVVTELESIFEHVELARETMFYLLNYKLYQENVVSNWQRFDVNVHPIQANWLDFLFHQAKENSVCEKFWMRGGIDRCINPDLMFLDSEPEFGQQMNKNSMFCIQDGGFVDFLRRVQAFYNGHGVFSDIHTGWNLVLHEFLNSLEHAKYTHKIIHKFQYVEYLRVSCLEQEFKNKEEEEEEGVFFLYRNDTKSLADFLQGSEVAYLLNKASNLVEEEKSSFIFKRHFCERWVQENGVPPYRHTINHEIYRKCERYLCFMDSSGTSLITSFCSQVSRTRDVANMIPDDKYYVWTTDLHAGPIACSLKLLPDVIIHAEIDFSNCAYSNTCKQRLKVLRNHDWQAFALDNTCPPKILRDFHDEYRNDFEMQRVDLVICSHPVANCELYLSLNRSLAIYPTTRLEFGRNDDHIHWRSKYMHVLSPARWKSWLDSLQRIMKKPWNFLLANNMYDTLYVEYFTGIRPVYVPSWCDPPAMYSHPAPKDSFLIGPYRDNIPEGWGHPVYKTLVDAIKKAGRENQFFKMSELYGNYKATDLTAHRGIVWIPYQTSTMSWFEFYRMNIPLFAPSLDLMIEWVKTSGILWERIYGHPKERLPEAIAKVRYPDPNSDASDVALRFWLGTSDWFQKDVFPYVIIFNSWDHLMELVSTTDLGKVSQQMKLHNEKELVRIQSIWKSVITQAVTKKKPNNFPNEDYSTSIETTYDIPRGPSPENHPFCLHYYSNVVGNTARKLRYPLQNVQVRPIIVPNHAMLTNCYPGITPGSDACNKYCPRGFKKYRSDLSSCIRPHDQCKILTKDACRDESIYRTCEHDCNLLYPMVVLESFTLAKTRETYLISTLCMLGLGFVFGLMFARAQYPIDRHDE